MSENHPLAAETELSLEQIANETLITLPPRCIPFQKGNQFQEYLTLHAQDHVHLVSDGEAESVLLAKCGYGIALLPGFFIEKELNGVSAGSGKKGDGLRSCCGKRGVLKKTERISRLYHVSETEAQKMMEDIDKRRRSNYNFYVTVQYLHSYESLRRKNDYDRKRKNVKAVDV